MVLLVGGTDGGDAAVWIRGTDVMDRSDMARLALAHLSRAPGTRRLSGRTAAG
jgi:hypothetical protein